MEIWPNEVCDTMVESSFSSLWLMHGQIVSRENSTGLGHINILLDLSSTRDFRMLLCMIGMMEKILGLWDTNSFFPLHMQGVCKGTSRVTLSKFCGSDLLMAQRQIMYCVPIIPDFSCPCHAVRCLLILVLGHSVIIDQLLWQCVPDYLVQYIYQQVCIDISPLESQTSFRDSPSA